MMHSLKNLFLIAVALAMASLIPVAAAQQGQAETLAVVGSFPILLVFIMARRRLASGLSLGAVK